MQLPLCGYVAPVYMPEVSRQAFSWMSKKTQVLPESPHICHPHAGIADSVGHPK